VPDAPTFNTDTGEQCQCPTLNSRQSIASSLLPLIGGFLLGGMDVLLARTGDPYIDGSNVFVNFVAIGKQNGNTLQILFRVQYGWGATANQRNAAIINAATAAKQAYEDAHGITLPVANRVEILL